jgi:hypothetical protein
MLRRHLLSVLAAGPGELPVWPGDPAKIESAELSAAVARGVQADFSESRVMHLDGWVLSATEARLCGLAALIL